MVLLNALFGNRECQIAILFYSCRLYNNEKKKNIKTLSSVTICCLSDQENKIISFEKLGHPVPKQCI